MTSFIQPLVTVAIPSFHHRDYVVKAIESVVAQEYSNIELIVLDDGSKDGSVEVIKQLQDKYHFIFIHRENRGLIPTLNEMLSLAKGEFFCVLGSDDFLTPNFLSLQIEFCLQNTDVALVCGQAKPVDVMGNELEQKGRRNQRRGVHFFNFEEVAWQKFILDAPGSVFRTACLKKVNGFSPTSKIEDWNIQLVLTSQGYKIASNWDAIVRYRHHPNNTSKRGVFMVWECKKTLDQFSSYPNFSALRKYWYLRWFKKLAKIDSQEARKLLPEVYQYWYSWTFIKSYFRILFK